jgi:hypothetical protein
VPAISASHAPATGREGRRKGSVASIARSGLRCVAHDLGLGVIQVVFAGRLDIATALQADGGCGQPKPTHTWSDSHSSRARASRFFRLTRLYRRLEIDEQFPRTTVQEVPV